MVWAGVVNSIYPLIRQKDFGSEDFFGSLGGLMGLFAGISVISIIEVSFEIFKAAFKRVMKFKNRNKVHAIWPEQASLPKNVSVNREHVLYHCSMFFYKFMKQSDIHGLHYITDRNKKLSERIFWSIAVLISTIFCSISIFDIIRHAELNPIEFAIDDKIWSLKDVIFLFKTKQCFFKKKSFKVPFPAIIVCVGMNMRKYREFESCVYDDECESLPAELQEKLSELKNIPPQTIPRIRITRAKNIPNEKYPQTSLEENYSTEKIFQSEFLQVWSAESLFIKYLGIALEYFSL